MRVLLLPIAASLGTLLLFAGPAGAAPDSAPLHSWSISKIEQGGGKVVVAGGAQLGGVLRKNADLGRVALHPRGQDDRATEEVFSSADGARYFASAEAPSLDPSRPHSAKGGTAHLDEYQAYVKRADDASLRIAISDLFLETIDANGRSAASECPPAPPCSPIRTVVRFHARAYAESADGDFFDVGGAVYLEGHEHQWGVGAATAPDARAPFWTNAQFDVEGDRPGTQASVELHREAPLDPPKPRTFKVPLGSIRPGELFAVHVSLDAEAINDRGHESYAGAFIEDPQHRGPRLLTAHGLRRRGKPRFKEPPVRPRPAARCPAGPRPHAGSVQLSGRAFAVGEASGTPLMLVTRTGGSRGATSVTVTTTGGSAAAGRDFRSTKTLVRFENGDTSPRLVEIPIREDLTAEPPEALTVSLAHPRCAKLGARRRAAVTILDDDQSSPAPAPAFTIGGNVDGLVGSGLMLSNLGAELAVSGNGAFTLPGTVADGQTYEVNVKTQPHNPDQVCTVRSGKGHVSHANVSDVAVQCAMVTTSSGLDPTFGSGGRVSTPVGGGQGEALVIQPSGGIVTAGRRTAGAGTDFALTRHNPDGTLDPTFGTSGIATTDFGGAGDQAHDAALLSDGGIVAVGETDAPGIQRQDFALVRYNPDGTRNASFGAGGVVTTDISGHGDIARAVAVQGDGKIVVAGFAAPSGVHSDFALVRYNPDGTRDQSFGTGGVVTTDFGAVSDDAARALAIQPDGKIVAAGTAGEDVALARYTRDGSLDSTFGNGGRTVTDLGFQDVANGVALTSAGQLLVAGSTIGAKLDNDFLLARYGPDGELDTTFGTLGVVKTDFGSGQDFAEDLTVDPAGRIVAVGRAAGPTISDMALARYKPDGTLDPTFADHGNLTADFHGAGDFGQDVALDAAGRIVAAGFTANGPDTEFALMRANP